MNLILITIIAGLAFTGLMMALLASKKSTRRERIAAAAMSGLLSGIASKYPDGFGWKEEQEVVRLSVQMADSLIEELDTESTLSRQI